MMLLPSPQGGRGCLKTGGAFVRDGDYTARSAVDIWLKDLAIVNDEAQSVGFTPEMANLALSLFKQTAEQGMGRQGRFGSSEIDCV